MFHKFLSPENLIVGGILSAVLAYIGGLGQWERNLLIAMFFAVVFDVVFALAVVFAKGKADDTSYVNSTLGRKGITKKLVMVLMVGFCGILDMTIFSEAPYALIAFASLYTGMELISIGKHLTFFGLPLPKQFVDNASKLTEGTDQK